MRGSDGVTPSNLGRQPEPKQHRSHSRTTHSFLVGPSNTWEPIPTRYLQDPESKLHWPLEHLGTNSDKAPARPRVQAPLASRTPGNQVSRGIINTKDPSSIGPSDTLKPSRPRYKQHPELRALLVSRIAWSQVDRCTRGPMGFRNHVDQSGCFSLVPRNLGGPGGLPTMERQETRRPSQ